MNVVLLNTVVILLMLAADTCHSQTSANLSCYDLPKLEFPSIKDFSAYGPYVIDFALTPSLDCTTEVFTNPPHGATNYDGTALIFEGATVTVYKYVVGSDRKEIDVTACISGEKSTWYAAAFELDENGSFFCLYSCNGTALADLECRSNNNGSSPNELKAVNLARRVPNGHRIHDGKQNCSARNGCDFF